MPEIQTQVLWFTWQATSSTGPSLQLLSRPFNIYLFVHACVLCVRVHVYTCHNAIGRTEDNSGELSLSFHFVEPRVSCFCCFTEWLAGLWASRWFCFLLPSCNRGAVLASACRCTCAFMWVLGTDLRLAGLCGCSDPQSHLPGPNLPFA